MPPYTLNAELIARFAGIQKHGDVSFGSSQLPNRWRADFAGWSLITQCMTGDYPLYPRVIPKSYERTFTIGSGEITGALRRCQPLCKEVSNKVVITFAQGGDELRFDVSRGEDGILLTEDVQCESDNPEAFKMACGIHYLQNAIKCLGTETICLRMNGPLNPMAVTPAGSSVVGYDGSTLEGHTCIVMPMGL